MLFSPIEQFNYFKLCAFSSNYIFFFSLVIFLIVVYLVKLLNYITINSIVPLFFFNLSANKSVCVSFFELNYLPTAYQLMFENFLIAFVNIFKSLIPLKNIAFVLNLLMLVIILILMSNLIGLVPFTYTITAQIFVTINLAMLLFISYNIIGVIKHNYKFIEIFMPSGLTLLLNYLLIPIELVSYIFRPISLSIRLFANIMAGHTLLKVICSFIYRLFNMNFSLFVSFLPFFLLAVLFGLELFVALIQAYVFFVLVCIFFKDIVSIAH